MMESVPVYSDPLNLSQITVVDGLKHPDFRLDWTSRDVTHPRSRGLCRKLVNQLTRTQIVTTNHHCGILLRHIFYATATGRLPC